MPGGGVADAGGGHPAGDEQDLDARLVERGEHAGQAGGAAVAAADALREAVELLALAAPGVLLDPLAGAAAHGIEARVLDVAGDAAGDALAQVGVQLGLELGDELVGRADQQPVEAAPLVELERDLGGVREVVLDLLVDAALVVGLRPAALVVAAVDVVLDPVGLLELVAVADEQAREPPVGEQHAPALGRAVVDERLHVRAVVEHHARLERVAQRHDLQQLRGLAGEHGDRARAVGGDAVPVSTSRTRSMSARRAWRSSWSRSAASSTRWAAS